MGMATASSCCPNGLHCKVREVNRNLIKCSNCRHADALIYGFRSLKEEKLSQLETHHLIQLRLYAEADSAMLNVMEGFMESAPQLLLQMYILLTHDNNCRPNTLGEFVASAT